MPRPHLAWWRRPDGPEMVQAIDADQLERLLDEGVPVVDVLDAASFRRGHIPGAVNVPIDADDLEPRLQKAAPDPTAAVVVYCRDPDCEASPAAAHILEEHLDYEQVIHFPGGLVGWRRSGRDLEGEGPRRLRLADLDRQG